MKKPRDLQLVLVVVLVATIAIAARGVAATTMNIEIDFMVARNENGNLLHSHKPQPDEIAAVVQMFACHGFTLNIKIDDEIEHQDVICADPNFPLNFWNYAGSGGFRAIRNAHFDHVNDVGWHYCVFGHRYSDTLDCIPNNSSGKAEILGDDFIVTLGSFTTQEGTPFERAATLAHEFGHNLGLRHCGDPLCIAGDNFKPNFASSMNYRFQLTGIRTNLEDLLIAPASVNLFKNIDYSNGNMCILNEIALNENFGSGMLSVDWDCNGSVGGTVSHDLNDDETGSWCQASGLMTIISDYDEWNSIVDVTSKMSSKILDTVGSQETPRCMSSDELAELTKNGLQQPLLEIESCISGKMVYLKGDAINPINDGSCELPFKRLGDAVASPLVPDGSVLYLRGGTYLEASSPLTISRPMKITSVGSAIISVPVSTKN